MHLTFEMIEFNASLDQDNHLFLCQNVCKTALIELIFVHFVVLLQVTQEINFCTPSSAKTCNCFWLKVFFLVIDFIMRRFPNFHLGLKLIDSSHFVVSSKKTNFAISFNFKLFNKYFSFYRSSILHEFLFSSL